MENHQNRLKVLIFRFSLSGLGTIQKTLKALITSVVSAFFASIAIFNKYGQL